MKRALTATLGLSALTALALSACGGSSAPKVEPGADTVVVTTTPMVIPTTVVPVTTTEPAVTTTPKPAPTTTMAPKEPTSSVLADIVAAVRKANFNFMKTIDIDARDRDLTRINQQYSAYGLKATSLGPVERADRFSMEYKLKFPSGSLCYRMEDDGTLNPPAVKVSC
jgi:hypothetical protein